MMRWRGGDAAAFAPLYARHKDPLYRYLLRGTGQPAVAAELFQETWAKLIETRATYEPRAQFKTWLYRIAQHRMIDHLRKRPRQPVPLDVGEMQVADVETARPEQQALAGERRERLIAALQRLPAEQCDAFLLHEEGGLTLEAIAEISGVGRETIKSRLRYALFKLREALIDDRT